MTRRPHAPWPPPELWNTRLEVDEVERLNMVVLPGSSEPLAFGWMNDAWLALRAQMRDGDELWSFSSAPESWQQLCGRAGFVLVRDGQAVAHLVTMMN